MTNAPVAGRKIDIGAVISRIFQLYGDTWKVLIPIALLLFLPIVLISALLRDSAAGSLLANILSLIASLFFAGVVVRAVQDAYEDRKVDASIGELFSAVSPVVFQLFLLGIVAGIAIGIGLILFIIPGLILLTLWSVAAPVVVLEKPGVFAALGRSRNLVRGNGWQVFGVLVAIFAIAIVLSIVIGAIGAIGDSFVVFAIFSLLLYVAIAPLQALVQAVLYFALKEAHGEPALSGSTGLIEGGGAAGESFAPPAAPEAPGAPAAPAAPQGETDMFGNPVTPEAAATPEPSTTTDAPGAPDAPAPESSATTDAPAAPDAPQTPPSSGGGQTSPPAGGSTPPPGYTGP